MNNEITHNKLKQRVLALENEVADLKRINNDLETSEALLKFIPKASPVGFGMVNNHLLTLVNERICDMSGYSSEELIGKNARILFPSDVNFDYAGKEKERPIYEWGQGTRETRWQAKDGKVIDVLLSSTPIDPDNLSSGITFTALDISKEKTLRTQLLQARKLEAIGTLAGGIAHDLNNMLGVIVGYTELAHTNITDPAKLKTYQDSVLQATHRAMNMVQQILAFSRKNKYKGKPFNLAPLVQETIKSLSASIPPTIEIIPNIDEDTATIVADPAHMHQLLMNLFTNAVHAMKDRGGVLEVALANVVMDVETAAQYADLEPGTYVKISVHDTGQGMDDAIKEHIFDPRFTTKKKDEGSGLGLAMVHTIVKNCGGAITVESSPGEGTTFDVFLPGKDLQPAEIQKPPETLAGRGNETLLFVDDEEYLVELGHQMLKRLGYTVTTETDPMVALETFRANPNKFDLVITDQSMPQMAGHELAQELMKIRPTLPIILCTGFSELIDEKKAKAIGIRQLLMKPFRIGDLTRVIRETLDK